MASSKTPSALGDGIVVVGRVRGPYGIQGWLHVAAFTDPVDNLAGYRPWLLADERQQNRWREAVVEELRPHKQGFVVRFQGIEDRTAAESLKGALIGVPEAALPAAGTGEYYWRDLVGARVIDQRGVELGRVTGLLETGAHDVLVIDPGDGASDELLIPFHSRYVLAVNPGAQEIRVDWDIDGGSGD